MNKPTIEAAIIEANRAKNPTRAVIDYDHRARCMDVLIDADALQEEADSQPMFWKGVIDEIMVREAPTVIEAEVSE